MKVRFETSQTFIGGIGVVNIGADGLDNKNHL